MHEHAARLRQEDCGPDLAVTPLVERLSRRRLAWLPQIGIGRYPVDPKNAPYDQKYFDQFDRNAKTDLGRALMRARCDFVEQHYHGPLIDVGIGSGAFIECRQGRQQECRQGRQQETWGYDINPAGLKWLEKRKLLIDPYLVPFQAMTMWDVLEHMADFELLLANCREWLFLSLPIFRDAEHVLRSKHFKPKEHCWYFTSAGIVFAMRSCGFTLVSESNVETELGREDIGTFAFRRKA